MDSAGDSWSPGDAWKAVGDLDRQAAGYGEELAAIDRVELSAYLREHGDDLPRTAQDVIDRHLDAIGGREAADITHDLTNYDHKGLVTDIRSRAVSLCLMYLSSYR